MVRNPRSVPNLHGHVLQLQVKSVYTEPDTISLRGCRMSSSQLHHANKIHNYFPLNSHVWVVETNPRRSKILRLTKIGMTHKGLFVHFKICRSDMILNWYHKNTNWIIIPHADLKHSDDIEFIIILYRYHCIIRRYKDPPHKEPCLRDRK